MQNWLSKTVYSTLKNRTKIRLLVDKPLNYCNFVNLIELNYGKSCSE